MGKDQPQRPAALHARQWQQKHQIMILFYSSTCPSQSNGTPIEEEKSLKGPAIYKYYWITSLIHQLFH